MRRLAFIILPMLLAACTSPTPGIMEKNLPGASHNRFTYCTGYGCTIPWKVTLRDEDWSRITAPLRTGSATAAAERRQIAQTVALFEQVVGKMTNTSDDEAGATVFSLSSKRGQLDCIDESHNTATLLHFLERDGLLHWHRVGPVAHRGMILDRWFHNTAVVIEKEGGDAYVIDSWFGLNGEPADVQTLEIWKEGWHPEGFFNGTTRAERSARRAEQQKQRATTATESE
jgi:hypothetical protein